MCPFVRVCVCLCVQGDSLQFLVYIYVITAVLLYFVSGCSSLVLLSVPREGCAS